MWTTSPCLVTTGKRAWAPPLCWPWSTRPSAGGRSTSLWRCAPPTGLRDRIIISSFNHFSILRFQALAPEVKLGFLEEGRRRNFYNDPTEDALILTRRFQKEGKA